MKKLALLFMIILVVLVTPITTKSQIEVIQEKTISPVIVKTPQEISNIEIEKVKVPEKVNECKVDEDCLIGTVCPMAIGFDRPMCVEGRCTCGPGREIKYPIDREKINRCIELRKEISEKLKEIEEKLREVGEEEKALKEELLKEAIKLKEEYYNNKCVPVITKPTPIVITPAEKEKYQKEKIRAEICMEVIDKIRKIEESAREIREGRVVINNELLKEAERLKEEYRECFTLPPVPLIAIEAAVKKIETVEEFKEKTKDLKEAMLNDIITQNLTGRELAEVVKGYNEKRKELVKEFVEKIHEINMEKMEEIKEVVVSKHVKWENENLINVTKITVTVNGKNVTIEPGDNVTIIVEGVVVKSVIPLKVKNNTIEDEETNQTINETPEKVKAKIKEQIREMRLERKQGIPVYAVAAVKPGRLFGIIPVNINVNYEIAATNGTTLTINKPWWSFLVFG
jgi:antitoxin (DNA-binding transcriptional repressor) of toxin-antitoxin stability system